jgi:hypothetical protein
MDADEKGMGAVLFFDLAIEFKLIIVSAASQFEIISVSFRNKNQAEIPPQPPKLLSLQQTPKTTRSLERLHGNYRCMDHWRCRCR